MPQSPLVGKIRYTYDGVEYFEAPLTVPGNVWDYASDGSWWVHSDSVIAIPPKSNYLHLSTTIQTADGYVPITVSLSINGSSCLVIMNESIARTRS